MIFTYSHEIDKENVKLSDTVIYIKEIFISYITVSVQVKKYPM